MVQCLCAILDADAALSHASRHKLHLNCHRLSRNMYARSENSHLTSKRENALCDNSPMHQRILQTNSLCARYEIIEVIIIKLYVEKAWIRSHVLVHLKGTNKAEPLWCSEKKIWMAAMTSDVSGASSELWLLASPWHSNNAVMWVYWAFFPSARRMVNVTCLPVRIRFAVW